FLGVALIMGQRLSLGSDGLGILFCVIGAGALTVATLAMRGASQNGENLLLIVGLQMLVGGAALLPVAALVEPVMLSPSWPLLAAFLYTTFIPGLLATFIWFILVDKIGPTRAATFHFLNPVFGVLLAWIILGEALRQSDLIGVAIIALGILAVQVARAAPHANLK
ncbi:MAG: DMT family transporter, partial [Pseudomonadota bacterium]